VTPQVLAVTVADRRSLAGLRVEHRQPQPLAVRPAARQPPAVRAHDEATALPAVRYFHVIKDVAGPVPQVEGRVPDPRRDPKSAAGLRGSDKGPEVGADRYGPVLAALQVREAQAGGGQGPNLEPVRLGGEEANVVGRQRDHRKAVIEPAAQV